MPVHGQPRNPLEGKELLVSLAVGGDVRLSGIKIGAITGQTLDSKSYEAIVRISIDRAVQLPDDSSIKVTSASLLGSNYLSIEPGGSETMLVDGGEITYTQPSIDIVGLLGQAIFSPTSGGGSSAPAPSGDGGAMP